MMRLAISVPRVHLELDKGALRRAVRAAGADVRATARRMMRRAGDGRLYYGIGGSAKYRGGYRRLRYRASSAGSAPVRVTGTLLRSIALRVFKSGEGVAIRDTAFYALFLEAGAQGGGRSFRGGGGRRRYARGVRAQGKTRVLKPRPFLSAALADRAQALGPRLGAALAAGVKLRRGQAPRR